MNTSPASPLSESEGLRRRSLTSKMTATPMGPPPPRPPLDNPNPNPDPDPDPDLPSTAPEEETSPMPPPPPPGKPCRSPELVVPYEIPPWSEPPGYPFSLEVLKDGTIIQQLDVSEKGAYMFGRIDLCDFVLEHPTISRFHAVLQFKKDGEVFLYDLGSTHGTFINKNQVKKKEYTKVHVGDVFRFGQSSRLYIFQGPSELMPPEGDLNKLRNAKVHQEMLDREASLLRAKAEASLADGISWGMAEDAIEEATENDADEVTWQTYTGQLTERQQKTRSKILKRMEKVYNMRKEIDAIRAKDIAQGGLTQGQQTQIARNEQRMNQIMEELESLEETLNESIQESIGARSGKKAPGTKKGFVEDEDETLSDDDDDFYDRTKKSPAQISSKHQSVETADTLIEKKESIISQMEEKKALLSQEQLKLAAENESNSDVGDDLDAYMTGISSQLVLDKTTKIQKELSDLQTELDRIMYLLKIADPMGEASKKRDLKVLAGATVKSNIKPQILKSNLSNADIQKPPQTTEKKINLSGKSNSSKRLARASSFSDTEKHPEEVGKDASAKKESKTGDITASSTEAEKHCEDDKISDQAKEGKTPAFTLPKPQWLGATRDIKPDDNQLPEINTNANESDGFVKYKDRKVALASVDKRTEIEDAAPGLIIRKRKPLENPGTPVDKTPKLAASSSAEAEATALDAIALLLKHKRGYHGLDDEGNVIDEQLQSNQSGKEISQPKRTFGPSKPAFLDRNPDYESWVPPEGQTGDGRTSLNDRLGY